MKNFKTIGFLYPIVSKKNLKMKLTTLLLLVAMFQVNANSYSQQTKLSLDLKRATLTDAIEAIEAQTEFRFLFKDNELDLDKRISIKISDITIDPLLTKLFKDAGIGFKVYDNRQIVLNKTAVPKKNNLQNDKVLGVVTDKSNTPMPGVTVRNLKTKKGTTTNFDGEYLIDAFAGDMLEFSYVGMKTFTVIVANNFEINVILEEDVKDLQEVVVIGYGKKSREELTGVVGTLKSAEFVKSPNANVLQGMQGKIAGVQIVSESGAPGAGFNITIRGNNSVSATSQPLYVIDGVQLETGTDDIASSSGNTNLGPMSFINPEDIESIQVLKDAASTSIFGSRGSNGVVMITTKSGKAGKNTMSVSAETNISQLPQQYEMLGMKDFITYKHLRDKNINFRTNTLYTDAAGNPRVFLPEDYTDTNWQSEALRVAVDQKYNLSFGTGSKKSNTFVALGLLKREGIVKNTNYQRINSSFKYTTHMNEKFTFHTGLKASYGISKGSRYNGEQEGANSGVIQSLLMYSPGEITNKPPGSEDEVDGIPAASWSNPIDLIERGKSETSLFKALLNANITYKPIQNVTVNGFLYGIYSFSQSNTFFDKTLAQGLAVGGKASIESVISKNFGAGVTATYVLPYGASKWTILGGAENRFYERGFTRMANQGFDVSFNGYDDIGIGTDFIAPSSSKEEKKGISYFSRLDYAYDAKYFATASVRTDGSSRFLNKWGTFYSGALAWTLSKEAFLEEVSWLNNLKVRTSYGTSGNDGISYGQAETRYNTDFYPGLDDKTIELATLIANRGNRDVTWETTAQFNTGLDINMFNNRLNLTLDYYKKNTKDLLLNADVSSLNGKERLFQNLGEVQNTGLEVQVSGDVFRTSKFTWTPSVTLAFNKSKIIDLGNNPFRRMSVGLPFGEIAVLQEGEAFGSLYGYVYEGVYQPTDFDQDGDLLTDGDGNTILPVASFNAAPKPGDMLFKDMDGDGIINPISDQTILGSNQPDVAGGIANTITYGKFTFSMNMNFSVGNEVFFAGKGALSSYNNTWGNVSQAYFDAAIPDENGMFRGPAVGTNSAALGESSSYYVEDASFLRIQSINIGYTFDKIGIKGLKSIYAYAGATNVYTFTNYSGFDPEVSSWYSFARGYERISYPRSLGIFTGIKLNF